MKAAIASVAEDSWHTIVEEVIAELEDGPVPHLPSANYPAKAAWLAHAVTAFNVAFGVARAAAGSAGQAKARWATLRTRIINAPARIASTGRRLVLQLAKSWPRAPAWETE